MSFDLPEGGDATNSAPDQPKDAFHQEAASDFDGGREAHAGESGAECLGSGLAGGAPPGNTAPHTCKASAQLTFKLVRLAVDSLYLSYPGDLSASVVKTLSKLRDYARSEIPEEQAKAQYPMGGHIFEVRDKGAGRFPFVLADNAFHIKLSNPGRKLPMAYVQISAEYLAHKGPVEVERELQELLVQFCDTEAGWHGANKVSRIDLAADFVTDVVIDSWDRHSWVTHASEIHSYAVDRQFTGWTVGMGGDIGARLYDKVLEIVKSGKAWVMNQWIAGGWLPEERVWRLEFEFKREFLKQRGLIPLEAVLDNLSGLWSYATTEWLRLAVPSESDTTRSRWPIHPLWVALASVDWQSASNAGLERFSNARTPDDQRSYAVLFGVLSSYMASHRLDDRDQAVNELLKGMHGHYELVAANKKTSFDELLARRVALKAREFNTAVNAPGLKDDLRTQAAKLGEEAYRQASRGW